MQKKRCFVEFAGGKSDGLRQKFIGFPPDEIIHVYYDAGTHADRSGDPVLTGSIRRELYATEQTAQGVFAARLKT